MLFIRVVLVPFWRGVSPPEFRAWFATHSEGIRRLMVPLGAAAGVTSASAVMVDTAERGELRTSSAVAAASAAGVGAITYAINEPANHELVRQDLADDETTRLLDRWARWHNARVVLGLLATAAAARALGSRV
jgi:hypothetical protein